MDWYVLGAVCILIVAMLLSALAAKFEVQDQRWPFLGLGIGKGLGERLDALLFLRQACGIVHVLMHGVLVALRSHTIHRQTQTQTPTDNM